MQEKKKTSNRAGTNLSILSSARSKRWPLASHLPVLSDGPASALFHQKRVNFVQAGSYDSLGWICPDWDVPCSHCNMSLVSNPNAKLAVSSMRPGTGRLELKNGIALQQQGVQELPPKGKA